MPLHNWHDRGAWRGCAALLLPAALLGCAGRHPPAPQPPIESAPPASAAAPPPAPGAPSADPLVAFEHQYRARAQAAMQAGRWVDATWAWDVVLALAPRDAQAAASRERALAVGHAQAVDHMQHAAQARQRGDLDSAVRLYLDALAADPDRSDAADALRQIERARAQRSPMRQTWRYPARGVPATGPAAPAR